MLCVQGMSFIYTDMLATRLAHEQKKNKQLTQLSPSVDRVAPNWMVPRPSERDENSLPRSLSPTSDIACKYSDVGVVTTLLISSTDRTC